jgi:hypothetical protein
MSKIIKNGNGGSLCPTKEIDKKKAESNHQNVVYSLTQKK